MKKIFFKMIVLFSCSYLFAQTNIPNDIKWSNDIKILNVGPDEAMKIFQEATEQIGGGYYYNHGLIYAPGKYSIEVSKSILPEIKNGWWILSDEFYDKKNILDNEYLGLTDNDKTYVCKELTRQLVYENPKYRIWHFYDPVKKSVYNFQIIPNRLLVSGFIFSISDLINGNIGKKVVVVKDKIEVIGTGNDGNEWAEALKMNSDDYVELMLKLNIMPSIEEYLEKSGFSIVDSKAFDNLFKSNKIVSYDDMSFESYQSLFDMLNINYILFVSHISTIVPSRNTLEISLLIKTVKVPEGIVINTYIEKDIRKF